MAKKKSVFTTKMVLPKVESSGTREVSTFFSWVFAELWKDESLKRRTALTPFGFKHETAPLQVGIKPVEATP